jgi:hypothetical protein
VSLFGIPTIDEVRHIMRTVEFRIQRTQPMLNKLEFNPQNLQLVKDWNVFTDERWKQAREKALEGIVKIRLANPLVLKEELLTAQDEFNTVIKGQGTLKETIALSPLIRRFEAATGLKIDEEGHPMPSTFDPDLEVYKAADAKIKAGEAAAKAAGKAVEDLGKGTGERVKQSLLSAIPWWVWAIGGVGVAGVGYSVVTTGRKVAAKAKRDTEYLQETFVQKALPGYKG